MYYSSTSLMTKESFTSLSFSLSSPCSWNDPASCLTGFEFFARVPYTTGGEACGGGADYMTL